MSSILSRSQSHKLIFAIMVLMAATLACSLSAGSAPESTAISLVITQEATATLERMPTATPQLSAIPTQSTQSSGNTVNTGGGNQDASCTPRADWQTYVVQAGDTIGSLAQRTGVTIEQFINGNCLANPDLISVGQTLSVPLQPMTIPTSQIREDLIVINPGGTPPANQCTVRNPRVESTVYVYTQADEGSFITGQLVTYAQYMGTEVNNGAWYQILVPNAGYSVVKGQQVVLEGSCQNVNIGSCRYTIGNVGGTQAPVHSGAGENFPISAHMPVGASLPVFAVSGNWVHLGTGQEFNGWHLKSSGFFQGNCDNI